MRRAAKVDANQAEIVDALRRAGCSVQHLHTLGQGCPDLLVGVAGVNLLMEVKSGNAALTDDEAYWSSVWSGQFAIVRSAEEALRLAFMARQRTAQ